MQLASGAFFGRPTHRREVNGLHVSEHAYAPDLVVPRHAHERAYVCLVVAGGYRERTGRHSRDCAPASLLVHPAGEEHEERFAPSGARIFHVELPPRIVDSAGAIGVALRDVHAGEGAATAVARRIRSELWAWDATSPLAVEGLALQLLAELGRPSPRRRASAPAWLPRVLELLAARFRDKLALDDIAREAGVHPAHLARAFRQHRRETLGEHVRRLRIEHACRELAAAERPIAAIALDAGFADQAHFCRVFKRLVGSSPSDYRANASITYKRRPRHAR